MQAKLAHSKNIQPGAIACKGSGLGNAKRNHCTCIKAVSNKPPITTHASTARKSARRVVLQRACSDKKTREINKGQSQCS